MYPQAVRNEDIRPVVQPEIKIIKFVPFSELEFEAKVPVVGEIKLADYTKIRKPKPSVTISETDINEVIKSLQTRLAERRMLIVPLKQVIKSGLILRAPTKKVSRLTAQKARIIRWFWVAKHLSQVLKIILPV